ncbi:DNA binding transcription coactivator transcription factor [Nowakowskiella sp. JEL0407]|nr:DNA binding transcription coactivator transcription factor [Nowakowskiella sp. JEL0407]
MPTEVLQNFIPNQRAGQNYGPPFHGYYSPGTVPNGEQFGSSRPTWYGSEPQYNHTAAPFAYQPQTQQQRADLTLPDSNPPPAQIPPTPQINKTVFSRKAVDSLGRRAWTEREDDILKNAVSREGYGRWTEISRIIQTRTPDACRKRWEKVLDPNIKKGPWSASEDILLIELVENLGKGRWTKVASHIAGRTDKQCRQRWFEKLASAESRKLSPAEQFSANYAGYQRSPRRNMANQTQPGSSPLAKTASESPKEQFHVPPQPQPFAGQESGNWQNSPAPNNGSVPNQWKPFNGQFANNVNQQGYNYPRYYQPLPPMHPPPYPPQHVQPRPDFMQTTMAPSPQQNYRREFSSSPDGSYSSTHTGIGFSGRVSPDFLTTKTGLLSTSAPSINITNVKRTSTNSPGFILPPILSNATPQIAESFTPPKDQSTSTSFSENDGNAVEQQVADKH